MKGKHWEGKDHHATHLFANMRQNPPFQHHSHHLHHFQTSQDQEEQANTLTTATTTTKDPPTAAATSDGATIELPPRNRRGRPPGSKNKPKPPLIITHIQPEPSAMKPCILEVPTGLDLIHSITQFSNKRNTVVCVLSATGAVSNVTLRQSNAASSSAAATITFHGRFDLLSLSATVFPSPTTSFSRACSMREFCISLGGPGGQVVGGTVVGPLYAAATVYVVAASFDNPSFHRLPVEEEDNEGRSSLPVGHGGGDGTRAAAAGEGYGLLSFYGGGQLGSNQVIWAPAAARPPSPPPY